MPASYLEIVQLANGEYALQRSDGEGDSLLRISFSKEAQDVLQQHSATVVRAMISAAIQTVSNLNGAETVEEEFDATPSAKDEAGPTIH